MKKLRVGVLGGTRGVTIFQNALAKNPYAEVVAICESFVPLKEKIESETGIRVFTDFDTFIDSGLDAVVIAHAANEHAPAAIKALKKGIHVYSENQPIQTLKEAVELCEAVESSGKIYAYGENYCYLPHVFQMRTVYESGDMGQVMCAEGTFINDLSNGWIGLTRGVRNHWRNLVPSTFYCTHSIGPMMYITGCRATSVVGVETPLMGFLREKGARNGSAAMEIMQLDNGGIGRSMHGNYRRSYTADYQIICENGTMETDPYRFGTIRFFDSLKQSWREETPDYIYTHLSDAYKHLLPKDVAPDYFRWSDCCVMNAFILSIMGDEEAKRHLIDVYKALDMSMVGTLAYRSILNNSSSISVPNFRNPAEREAFRNDNRSTDPNVSFGADLLPSCKSGFVEVDDALYKQLSDTYLAGLTKK